MSPLQSNPLISLSDVGIRYRIRKGLFRKGYYDALRRVSLSIAPSDAIGIVGSNGSGKSTLLQVLAGVLTPDSGSISVRPGTSISLLALQVGFDPELSGRDNAYLSALLLGLSRREAQAGVNRVIEFAELEGFAEQPIRTYSAGMRARLGFAVALHTRPDVLLIDEILSVGDAHFRRKSAVAMLDNIRARSAIVLVSHDPTQILSICNRVIWLQKGEVMADGAPEEVLHRYDPV